MKFIEGSRATLCDISETALKVSRINAVKLGVGSRVEIIKKDILNEKIDGIYDILISNPPYISDKDYQLLMDDVRLYEPETALNSPGDEYKFYKRITTAFSENIKPGGYLFFEVGYNMSKGVAGIIKDTAAYKNIKIIKDYSGIERVVSAQKI